MTQEELTKQVAEILGDDFLSLRVWNYQLSEDLETQEARILCSLQKSNEIEIRAVNGSGVGFIDALFKGLRDTLAADYPSLNRIHFVDFTISGDFSRPSEEGAGSDAIGRVRLVVENSSDRQFTFESATRSISGSSVAAVVAAAEHFVNAERAVLKVYEWIEDAQRRNRPVLVERYVQRLALLVKNASYSEVIERKKRQVGV